MTIISAGLSRLETGTRIVIANNIRDLGQEDWSAVMRTGILEQTTSRNGYYANHNGYQ